MSDKNKGGNMQRQIGKAMNVGPVTAILALALVIFLAIYGVPDWNKRITSAFQPTATPEVNNVIVGIVYHPAYVSLIDGEAKDAYYTLTMNNGLSLDVQADIGDDAQIGGKFDYGCFCALPR